jgi:hypothetical protein
MSTAFCVNRFKSCHSNACFLNCVFMFHSEDLDSPSHNSGSLHDTYVPNDRCSSVHDRHDLSDQLKSCQTIKSKVLNID